MTQPEPLTSGYVAQLFPHDWGRPLSPGAHRICCSVKLCPPAVYVSCAVSCGLFGLIYATISYICPRVSSRYRTLSVINRTEWSTRLVSAVHAAVSIYLTAVSFTYERALYEIHPIFSHPPHAVLSLCVTTGFFVFDALVWAWAEHASGKTNLRRIALRPPIPHHVFYIAGIGVVLHYHACALFALVVMLGELTSPLLNARWFLKTHGYAASSAPFVANGALLFVLHVLVRLLLPAAVVAYAKLYWGRYHEGVHYGYEVAAWFVFLNGMRLNVVDAAAMHRRLAEGSREWLRQRQQARRKTLDVRRSE